MADEYTQEVRRHDPYGYVRHFLVGAAGAAGVALLGVRAGLSPVPAALAGIAAAIAAGIAGELKDAYTGSGVVDWRDASFTALGGLAALLLLLSR